MKIKLFPRSWVQIKYENQILYIDPSFVSSYYKKYKEIVKYSEEEDDYLPNDFDKGNIILISHIHKDHCKNVNIERLSNKLTTILSPEKYKKDDDKRIKIVHANEKLKIDDVEIETVVAYNTNDGASTKKVHKIEKSVGYIIKVEGKKIYFAGDTDLIPEMYTLGDIDIAFLPIGGTFTMNIDEAVQAVKIIKPKICIPMHYLKQNPNIFKYKIENTETKIEILEMGEGIEL